MTTTLLFVSEHFLDQNVSTLGICIVKHAHVGVVVTALELLNHFLLPANHFCTEVEHVLDHDVLLHDVAHLVVLLKQQLLPSFLSNEKPCAVSCSLVDEL